MKLTPVALILSLLACTPSRPSELDAGLVSTPEVLKLVDPHGNESCGESCTSSYPIGCNSVCNVCGTVAPGALNGKCVHGLP